MRQAIMWGAGILVSAGLLAYEPLASAPTHGPSRAVVSANDGYGVSECLTSGDACGALVAQGWCQSNGYRRLVAYRKANPEDVTGSVGTLVSGDDGHSVVINCGS